MTIFKALLAMATKFCAIHGPYPDRYSSCPRCN